VTKSPVRHKLYRVLLTKVLSGCPVQSLKSDSTLYCCLIYWIYTPLGFFNDLALTSKPSEVLYRSFVALRVWGLIMFGEGEMDAKIDP
jgi:hypothetical protein